MVVSAKFRAGKADLTEFVRVAVDVPKAPEGQAQSASTWHGACVVHQWLLAPGVVTLVLESGESAEVHVVSQSRGPSGIVVRFIGVGEPPPWLRTDA